jgi:hypothetical protein
VIIIITLKHHHGSSIRCLFEASKHLMICTYSCVSHQAGTWLQRKDRSSLHGTTSAVLPAAKTMQHAT